VTPDHKFELLRTVISIIPATALSAWALIHQRRQTAARLDVLLSPIFAEDINGKSVLQADWPGVVVRNQSNFSLRVSSVGYSVGKKFYSFEKPFDNSFKPVSEWPLEIAPRSRVAFYPGPRAQQTFASVCDGKSRKFLEVGRAYAFTECNKRFQSPRASRKTRRWLGETDPLKQLTHDGE